MKKRKARRSATRKKKPGATKRRTAAKRRKAKSPRRAPKKARKATKAKRPAPRAKKSRTKSRAKPRTKSTKRTRVKARTKAARRTRPASPARKPKPRKPRVDRTKRALRAASAARPRPAEEALPRALAVPGPWERLAPRVAAQLEARGWSSPDPAVVEAIAAVAAGYRKGPAADPPFPSPFDADDVVADAFVDFYWMGSRDPAPDRRERLPEVRAMVQANLALLGLGQTSATARDTIAWIVHGVWRPGFDEIARLHALPGYLVPRYRDGLE